MKPKQKRMRDIVKRFRKYVETYDKQHGYFDSNDTIFIDDMVYGIGIAIDPKKYKFAYGYESFKVFLSEYIKKTTHSID